MLFPVSRAILIASREWKGLFPLARRLQSWLRDFGGMVTWSGIVRVNMGRLSKSGPQKVMWFETLWVLAMPGENPA